MLATPAEPCLRCERDFENRRTVGEDAKAKFTDFAADALREHVQAAAHHLVVIASKRVTRDVTLTRVGKHGVRLMRVARPIVHSRADDAQRARDEISGPRTACTMARHIIHVAMSVRAQPIHEPDFVGREFRIGDTDFFESERASPRHDQRRQRGPIATIGAHRRSNRALHAH